MVAVDIDGLIDDDDLPEEIPGAGEPPLRGSPLSIDSPVSPVAPLIGRTLAQVEQMLIEATLKSNGGNREETAKSLGIGERTLYRKLKEYEISKGGGEPE